MESVERQELRTAINKYKTSRKIAALEVNETIVIWEVHKHSLNDSETALK